MIRTTATARAAAKAHLGGLDENIWGVLLEDQLDR
jgi:hypothetical protein